MNQPFTRVMAEPYLNISNITFVNDNSSVYWNEDLERYVSTTVFIFFTFIFFAGLIGNLLVIISESPKLLFSTWNLFSNIYSNFKLLQQIL